MGQRLLQENTYDNSTILEKNVWNMIMHITFPYSIHLVMVGRKYYESNTY